MAFAMRQIYKNCAKMGFVVALVFGVSLSGIASPAVAQSDAQAGAQTLVGDIPLMPNTSLDRLRSVSFDTVSGRILVLFVEMRADAAAIRAFYLEALTALGWSADGARFIRRGEMLKLQAAPEVGNNIWKLTLSPLPAS